MAGQMVHFEIPAGDTAQAKEFWGGLFGWEFQAFEGSPTITIVQMVEENDVVMAELRIVAKPVNAEPMRMVAGEVFVMRDGLIKERRAYLVPLRENSYK